MPTTPHWAGTRGLRCNGTFMQSFPNRSYEKQMIMESYRLERRT